MRRYPVIAEGHGDMPGRSEPEIGQPPAPACRRAYKSPIHKNSHRRRCKAADGGWV
jgi:hypothetical protein